MGQNIGRAGRRRRVMKEEVLSASFAAYNSSPHNAGMEPGDTPRYGVGANIENHPQITDFVPRRYRVIGLISILGIAVGIFSEFVYYFAPQLGEWTKVMVAEKFVKSSLNVSWLGLLLQCFWLWPVMQA